MTGEIDRVNADGAEAARAALRLRERIWLALGFGACSNPNPWPDEMPGFAPAYVTVNTIAVLDWRDRLRVLLSGKLMVAASVKTDVMVGKAETASHVSVLPPYSSPRR